jgi:2-oxoglutarate ferredoxin oxidoreductase subunit delta
MTYGTIVINEDRCKGCELCTPVCPKNLIHIAVHFNQHGYHPAAFADPNGQCTGCLLCSTICPDVAITVYRELGAGRELKSLRRLQHHAVR